MKALLLAAGLGSRLRPLTYDMPKCLVPVKGLPVLGHWLHLLEKHGFTEVLINTGYQARRVEQFLETFYTPLKIETIHERFLLGTGGTIKANWKFFLGEEVFLVAHVDNFTNANLSEFKQSAIGSLGQERPAAVGLFRCPRPEECGVVEMDENGIIQKFHEKVKDPPGNLANAGIYLLHQSLKSRLDRIENSEIDFCRHVLAPLGGRMLGWPIGNAFLIDIGNLEAYQQANLDPSFKLEFPVGRTDVESLLSPIHLI